jgi:hypothetical protein
MSMPAATIVRTLSAPGAGAVASLPVRALGLLLSILLLNLLGLLLLGTPQPAG